MSLIEIRKYEYQADRAKNYFASPTFIDGISLDKILIEGFPIFNEEFANEFDSFEYKASDYDLVFSRLENTLTTNGDTLETFLSTDLDNHCLACKVTIGSKVFGGLIDVNSITFIDNLDSDGYKIKVTIFSFAKEFALFAQGSPKAPQGYDLRFNKYIGTYEANFWRDVDGRLIPAYITPFSGNLNWVERVGYEPEIIRELWASLIDNNNVAGCSCWKLFEDLCSAFGLIYKFEVVDDYADYFGVLFSLAFRDTGFSSDTISVNWIDRERGFISDINANVIQCFKLQKGAFLVGASIPQSGSVASPEDTFYGVVFNKDTIATYDGDVPQGQSFEEAIYSNGEGMTLVKLNDPFPFDVSDKVNFIEMNYYFPTYYGSAGDYRYYVLANSSEGWYSTPQIRIAKNISFPRMFTKAGYEITEFTLPLVQHNITYISHPDNIHYVWNDLIENTAGTCYPYLLQTFRKYVKGNISLLNDFDVNLFDKITVNSETYTIYKLSNLDLNNRQVEIFAIQD